MATQTSAQKRGRFGPRPASAAVHVTVPVRKPVRKAIVIVRDLITSDMDVSVGANAKTTTLYRCGAVMTNVGAPTGDFVNDSCTMVRFIFNGGIVPANVVQTSLTAKTVFIVVARIETSLKAAFRTADNEFLTASLQDVENIFYSGAFPVFVPQQITATGCYSVPMMPISIDMKAKRKMNIGDSIVMYTFMDTDTGVSSTDVLVSGVATVIAI